MCLRRIGLRRLHRLFSCRGLRSVRGFLRPCRGRLGRGFAGGSFARCRCLYGGLPCGFTTFSGVVVSVSGVVAFAGSRSLSPRFAPLVASVVGSVVRSGRSMSVGCCVGADAFALAAVPVGSGMCFAAFGPGGVGSCSLSAVTAVSAVASCGGVVSWWSGGSASVALPARLAARTGAVVSAATVSAVVFFGSPGSRGSALAASLAVGRGLPVFAFPCGFPGSALPLLGAGSWVAVAGSGVWAASWRWVPAQVSLF